LEARGVLRATGHTVLAYAEDRKGEAVPVPRWVAFAATEVAKLQRAPTDSELVALVADRVFAAWPWGVRGDIGVVWGDTSEPLSIEERRDLVSAILKTANEVARENVDDRLPSNVRPVTPEEQEAVRKLLPYV